MARRRPNELETAQIALVDVASGATQVVAGDASLDTGARWLLDGSLLYVSDADGWFQVVRLTADGHDRIVLTWRNYLSRVALVAVFSALDIGLSQWSFEFITVSLYTMTKTTAVLFILIFALVFKLERKVLRRN